MIWNGFLFHYSPIRIKIVYDTENIVQNIIKLISCLTLCFTE